MLKKIFVVSFIGERHVYTEHLVLDEKIQCLEGEGIVHDASNTIIKSGMFKNNKLTSGFKRLSENEYFYGNFDDDENLVSGKIYADACKKNLIKDGSFHKNGKLREGFLVHDKLYHFGIFDEDEILLEGEIYYDEKRQKLFKKKCVKKTGKLYQGWLIRVDTDVLSYISIPWTCYHFGFFNSDDKFEGWGASYRDMEKTDLHCQGFFENGTLINGMMKYQGLYYVGNFDSHKLLNGNGAVYYDIEKTIFKFVGYFKDDELIFGFSRDLPYSIPRFFFKTGFIRYHELSLETLQEFQNILTMYPQLVSTIQSELIVLLFEKQHFYTDHPACLEKIESLNIVCRCVYDCLDVALQFNRYYDPNIGILICTYIQKNYKPQPSPSLPKRNVKTNSLTDIEMIDLNNPPLKTVQTIQSIITTNSPSNSFFDKIKLLWK